MNGIELKNSIETSYRKYFPNSEIRISYNGSLFRSIWVTCFLSANKSECQNDIRGNDMLSVSFEILGENDSQLPKGFDMTQVLPDILILENKKKWYMTKPTDRYCVYGHRNLSFRKVKGDAEKIAISLDKFFAKLRESLMDDLLTDNIHAHYSELLAQKLGIE